MLADQVKYINSLRSYFFAPVKNLEKLLFYEEIITIDVSQICLDNRIQTKWLNDKSLHWGRKKYASLKYCLNVYVPKC